MYIMYVTANGKNKVIVPILLLLRGRKTFSMLGRRSSKGGGDKVWMRLHREGQLEQCS